MFGAQMFMLNKRCRFTFKKVTALFDIISKKPLNKFKQVTYISPCNKKQFLL